MMVYGGVARPKAPNAFIRAFLLPGTGQSPQTPNQTPPAAKGGPKFAIVPHHATESRPTQLPVPLECPDALRSDDRFRSKAGIVAVGCRVPLAPSPVIHNPTNLSRKQTLR